MIMYNNYNYDYDNSCCYYYSSCSSRVTDTS
jgi:hypothetical protein